VYVCVHVCVCVCMCVCVCVCVCVDVSVGVIRRLHCCLSIDRNAYDNREILLA